MGEEWFSTSKKELVIWMSNYFIWLSIPREQLVHISFTPQLTKGINLHSVYTLHHLYTGTPFMGHISGRILYLIGLFRLECNQTWEARMFSVLLFTITTVIQFAALYWLQASHRGVLPLSNTFETEYTCLLREHHSLDKHRPPKISLLIRPYEAVILYFYGAPADFRISLRLKCWWNCTPRRRSLLR